MTTEATAIVPSVFFVNCVSRQALDLVADKWAAIIFYALQSETCRFSDLRRRIEGISQKMLTETLRDLELNGLVQRTIYPTNPPAVDYRLTPLGETLREPTNALCSWAEQNVAGVVEAREDGGVPVVIGRIEDLGETVTSERAVRSVRESSR